MPKMEYIIVQVFPKCSLLFNSATAGEGKCSVPIYPHYVLTVILDFVFAAILYAQVIHRMNYFKCT